MRVSTIVCDRLVSQLSTAPVERTASILQDIEENNPEFILGISNFFTEYMKMNEEASGPLRPEIRETFAKNGLLFAAIAYKLLNMQEEVDNLEDIYGAEAA